MRLVISYLLLQWKRCAKALLKSLAIVGGTLLLVVLILLSMIKILTANESFALAQIGVVIPKEEALTEYVTSYIESMDSVKSICKFNYMEETEALKKFEDGELSAVVVIPDGFYHDVQVGLNPPARIYFPKDAGLISNIFKEVMISGVSYLQTAEAGVYATLDAAGVYGADVEYSQIGNIIALQYVNEILSRDKMFDSTVVSALGDLSVIGYYLSSGIVIILMFSGICYSFLYSKNSKAVEDKLKVNGLNRFACGILKTLSMFPFVYVTGMMLYGISLCINNCLELELFTYSGSIWGYMAILAITLSIYFELVFDITGEGKAGIFVLIILNIIGCSVCGLIIPQAYMADWVSGVGNVLPMKYWVMLMTKALFGIGGVL